MLKLYVADISQLDTDVANYSLSDYRLAKLAKITIPQVRRQSIGAELLLNYALRTNAAPLPVPLRITKDSYGKPYLENSHISFSLSHSGSFVACAISHRPVGVDIQKLTYGKMDIARRFFAPDEQEFLRQSPEPDLEFTRIWSLKESCVKAIGKGLQLPLNSFSVLEAPNVWILGSNWLLSGYKTGDYYLSVCSKEPQTQLTSELVTL